MPLRHRPRPSGGAFLFGPGERRVEILAVFGLALFCRFGSFGCLGSFGRLASFGPLGFVLGSFGRLGFVFDTTIGGTASAGIGARIIRTRPSRALIVPCAAFAAINRPCLSARRGAASSRCGPA